MILCHYRNYYHRCLEAASEDNWLRTNLAMITTFDRLSDATGLRHNAFVTSASLNKGVFAFHLSESLYAIKSSYDKYKTLIVSFDKKFINSIRNPSDWPDKPCHSYAVSGLAR